MDYYTIVSLLTVLAFFLLAALLLVPVYLFLKREENVSEKKWTRDALDRRRRERPPTNGHGQSDHDD